MIHYLFLKENHFIDIEYFLDLVNKMIFPHIKCDHFYDFRCAPAWESSNYIVYTWYWLIMGFLLPLVIIIYANFKTVQCLKKVKIINIRLFILLTGSQINSNRCQARRLQAKASKVEVPLSPVAYLIYARSRVIIICRPLGKYN